MIAHKVFSPRSTFDLFERGQVKGQIFAKNDFFFFSFTRHSGVCVVAI